MAWINTTQQVIFGATFLGASLIANVALFTGNSGKASQISELNEKVSELETQLETHSFVRQQQQQRLNNMGGQQEELGVYIRELQTQLTELQTQQQDNIATAQLAQKHLTESTNRAANLETRLANLSIELDEANKTVANQQRYIRSLLAGNTENTDDEASRNIEKALTELTGKLSEEYTAITIAQSANGEGLIHIPLQYLFVAGGLDFNEQAESLLQALSDSLANLPMQNVTVIGHADARPIVSDLANLYPTNWELSSVRASKVVQAFVEAGVADQRLTAAGKSANSPIREEANAEAWDLNRRIEIQIHP